MIVEALLEAARKFPDRLATKDAGRQFTYAQLVTLAKAFRRLVLKETRCERVGVMLPSTAGTPGVLFGALWGGKTIVPLNFLLQQCELEAVIQDSGIDLVISTEHFENFTARLPVRTLYLEQLGMKRRFFWEKFRRTPEPPQVAPQDVAAIIYTSGTTAQPKGVCLSYNNLASNSRASIKHLRFEPDHHLLGLLPPFHVFGLTVLNILPSFLGGTVTYIPRFSPQAAYQAIINDRITVLIAVASMYGAIGRLKSLEAEKLKNTYMAVSGGEPLPRAVYDEFYRRTGIRISEGYGMTETSPVVCCDLPWDHHVGTVGLPIPDVQVSIRDGNGETLAGDQEGEICVRGPCVMKGYYNRPEETAAVIDADGWLRTGDLGRVDVEGRISITGRAKDLIIVAGENVYPREVEAVLESHPSVAESAVIGRQDGSRGEVVTAYVALREGIGATEEELRSFCRDRLAGYKAPRKVYIRKELPHGPTGKVLKRALREELG